MCSVLHPWELTPNSIVKIRFLFGVRRWGGNTEQLTFFKKMGLGTAKPQFMVWQYLDPKFLYPLKLNKSPKNEPKYF